jgi:ketosteroid isomerase-like protein
LSAENVALVKALQPPAADLVELFVKQGLAPDSTVGAEPSPFAPDLHVEFVSQPDADRLTYRGVEGFVRGWQDWLEPWASYWTTAEEFIDAGDSVVVMVKVSAKTARGGVAVEHAPATIWTIKEGKVVSLRFYLDRDDALREAGIPSPERSAEEPSR